MTAGPGSDPRTKPELVEVLREYTFDVRAEPPAVDRADGDAVFGWVGEAHDGFEGLYEALPNDLPGDEDVACTFETVAAADGHLLEVRIYRPEEATGPMPGVIYYHGGGMTILSAFNKVHRRWCEDLAARGMVVVGVGFRNAHCPDGPRPFPLGRDDCYQALRWVDANRADLGIGKLVLLGESGGANLALSTALLAQREGAMEAVDGVYAQVPYISGGYGWDAERRARELPSMVELDGYFVTCGGMALLAEVYDPGGREAENPLCWPLAADPADLRGLPPHVITVNELDPLRDEGIAYFRKLQAAGVPVLGRVNLGLTHAAELIFRQSLASDYFAAVGDVHRFARSL